MSAARLFTALGAFALLCACEARVGKDSEDAKAVPAEAAKSPVTKAEEGQLSIDAPGFQMKIDIPATLVDRAEVDSDSGILYPGATLSGMHVAARDRSGSGTSTVELRFISSDPPAKVAAWYRDPARSPDFSIASAKETGGTFAIAGTQKKDGDPFDLSLGPREGGGTDGSIRLRDRG